MANWKIILDGRISDHYTCEYVATRARRNKCQQLVCTHDCFNFVRLCDEKHCPIKIDKDYIEPPDTERLNNF